MTLLQESFSAATDLDEWTRGVLFPLVTIFVAAMAGWAAKCLTTISREFRKIRSDVAMIRHALHRAGLLNDLDG